MIFIVELMAERTAANWMRTSEQSRPDSTIVLTAFKWPVNFESRFRTAFVFVWVWVWHPPDGPSLWM
jgi:hypothetical protein